MAYFDQVTQPSDPTREGHELDGWFEVLPQGYTTREQAEAFWGSDPDFEDKIHFDDEDRVLKRYSFVSPVTHDLELRAEWKANTFAVTYMSGSEIVDEQDVAWGQQAATPQDPYRYGYAFEGWCTDEELTELYDFEMPVTQKLVLHARFRELVHTVTFDSAGGSTVGTQSVKHGGHAIQPADPVWEGHAFLGWFEKGATEPFNFGQTLILGDVTLEAQWSDADDSDSYIPGSNDSSTQGHGLHISIVNNTSAPVISQREGSFDAVMRTMFGQEATEQNVYVTLSSRALKKSGLDEHEKSLVQRKLDELSARAGTWFDLSLGKRVGSEQAEGVAVHTTDKPIKLSVTIPANLRSGDTTSTRTFYVLRVHDDTVEVLAKGAGENLEFESDRFSTYLIAYTGETKSDKAVTATKQTTSATKQATARTGDTTPSVAPIACLALALIVLGKKHSLKHCQERKE